MGIQALYKTTNRQKHMMHASTEKRYDRASALILNLAT
jgi:hypothetical protein